MSNRPEFIQLEAGDDANSVRDRLSFIRGERVLLIWPEEGTILTRKLDLVLIQREAMRRAIRLALVTHDPLIIKHAEELNISTFETIGASERGRWRRGRSKVFTNRFQRPKNEPESEELKEVASRIRDEEDAPTQKRRRTTSRLIVLGIVLGIAAAVAYVIAPGANIRLTPAKSQIDLPVQLVADPQATTIDVENGIIPATVLSVQIEDSGTIETTGTLESSDVPATGSVVFINQTSDEIIIPAGTTVTTSTGTPIQFRTIQEASLPSGIGLQIEVPIEAFQTVAGEIGNVDSGLINTIVGPLAERATVRNLAPTVGGESRSLRAASAADQERLLATMRQQLQAKAFLEMQPRLNESQFIILETVRIAEERSDWTTFSAQPGEAADTLTLTMRAVVQATAVDQQLGEQIVFARLGNQKPESRVIETVSYERGAVESIDPNGRVTFGISGSALVRAQIDPEALKERLAGRSLNDAIAFMVTELDLAQGFPPEVNLSPDWFGSLPLLSMRIEITLQDYSL